MSFLKKIVKFLIPYGIVKFYMRKKHLIPAEGNEYQINEKFYSHYKKFEKQKMESPNCNDFVFGKVYPCKKDETQVNGLGDMHYFHQDLLIARRIFENKPENHIDVGSSVGGFVAHVASFRKITVFDVRPSIKSTHNITFFRQDFMANLDQKLISSTDSVSCLHAIEHFGLGRYGDPINYDGHLLGIENLYRILKKNGKMYFSVPIGYPQRIEFHAHRVFDPNYLLKIFDGKFRQDYFSYVDDNGDFHENSKIEKFKGTYCCGIFEMTKL